jgi:hypothetical protein
MGHIVNDNELLPHIYQDNNYKNTDSVGKDAKQLEPWHTVGENAKWHSCNGI